MRNDQRYRCPPGWNCSLDNARSNLWERIAWSRPETGDPDERRFARRCKNYFRTMVDARKQLRALDEWAAEDDFDLRTSVTTNGKDAEHA